MGITIIKPVIINISIHALVKRATFAVVKVAVDCVISIHALVKRATKAVILYLTNITFQSTPS